MQDTSERSAVVDRDKSKAQHDEQFAIAAASSLQDVRPLVLKHGDGFGVFDSRGRRTASGRAARRAFTIRTRGTSPRLTLTIDGEAPLLLSSTLRDDNATLTCDLTNPDFDDSEGKLELHTISSICAVRDSYGRRAVSSGSTSATSTIGARRVEIAFEFAADFADLFEVRGFHRKQRGDLHEPGSPALSSS